MTAPGMPAQKYALDRRVTTIGRSSTNDLPIPDKMLSRQHARIVRDNNGGLTIEDLGSRNGTFVNGERLVSLQPSEVGRPRHGRRRDAEGRVGVHDPRPDRRPAGEDALDNTILKASAELLRQHTETDPRLPAEQLSKLIESLRVVNELTIELLRDVSVDELLKFLMDKVFETLKPDRGVVLLRSQPPGSSSPPSSGSRKESRPTRSASRRPSSRPSWRRTTACSSWIRRPPPASPSPTRSGSPGSSRSSPRPWRTTGRSSASSMWTSGWATGPSRRPTCGC